MNLAVRKATPADSERIADFHRRAIRETNGSLYTPEQIDAWSGLITAEGHTRSLEKEYKVVAEDAQYGVVGFGALLGGEIKAVYADPLYHGKGVGRALIMTLEDVARKEGQKTLVLDSSLSAVGFYERMGYKQEGTKMHKVGDSNTSISVVLMRKILE